jgi:hypothetical protein
MPHIFISYCKKDTRTLALDLCDHLNRQPGFSAWVDRSLRAGQSWESQIQAEIDKCDYMVVLYSPDINRHKQGMEESYVLTEIHYAKRVVKKTIIPVMAQETDPPMSLMREHYIDFTLPGLSLADLVAAILGEVGGIQTSPPAPLRVQRGESDSPSTYSERGLGGEVMAAELTRLTRAVLKNDPLFEWVFIRGSGGKKIVLANHGESFPVADFFMAKYQTTNRQYQVFVDSPDGYADPRWWDYSDSARAWRGARPKMGDTVFKGDALPRTSVTWYDSVAFTRWLDWKMRELTSPPSPLSEYSEGESGIRLPSEWEWQWAAVRDTGWDYPWGNAITAEYAVYGLAWKKGPAPVGSKPKGASPDGLLDMAGNVWEWCLNEYSSLDANLVNSSNNRTYGLRGGSFYPSTDYLRASIRGNFHPDNEDNFVGVRCFRSY